MERKRETEMPEKEHAYGHNWGRLNGLPESSGPKPAAFKFVTVYHNDLNDL